MTRLALLIFALMALEPCFATTAPAPLAAAAAASPQPLGAARPTCQAPDAAPFAGLNLGSKSGLDAARRHVIEFSGAADAFAACLFDALAVLQGDWKAAQTAPNVTVELAVANVISNWQFYKRMSFEQFNWSVRAFNAALPPASTGALVPLGALPSQAAGPMTKFDSATRLNLPSYGILATHDCSDFYPPESRIAMENGNTLVAYDVSAEGTVHNVRIVKSSGIDRLDKAALSCVSNRWQNAPAIANGVPVEEIGVQAMVVFSLG